MEKAYRKAGIFVPYADMKLSSYVCTDDNEEAFLLTQERIFQLPNIGLEGILYVGPPGTGKTMLANIYAKAAVDAGIRTRVLALAHYVYLLQKQMSDHQAFMKSGDPDLFREWAGNRDYLQFVRNSARLLVLDDVGKEYGTDNKWAQSQFDFLIRYRWSRGLTTVMTSNLPIPEWDASYSDATQSFVHEACTIVHIAGDDVRRSDYGEG